MKRYRKTILGAALLVGGLILPSACSLPEPPAKEDEFVDPISYDEDRVVDYDHPTRIERAPEGVVAPSKVHLHYHNDDNACLGRRFYTWVTGVDGIERKPIEATWTATDMEIELDFSVLTEYADMPSLFFIIKVAGTWAGQSEDTEIVYADWADKIDGGILELWTIPGEGTSVEIYGTEAETKLPKIQTAKFTDFKTIHCVCTVDDKGKAWIPQSYKLYAFDKSYFLMTESAQNANKAYYLFKEGTPTTNEFDIHFNYTAKINVQYMIESVFPGYEEKTARIVVSYENLYEYTNSQGKNRFEEFYSYNGDDLGMTYTPQATTFKLWSPVSALASVNIYDRGDPAALGLGGNDNKRSYQMNYLKGGVWSVTIQGDLKGKYYTYSVTHSAGTVEAMDPYAKACGVNGVRAFIYDNKSAEANPGGWDTVPSVWNGVTGYDIRTPQDLSIYEVHIRDLTMDSTWISNNDNPRGTYAAFAESGTRYTKNNKTVTTGFDHIEELGVKAIQLLPVFDADNDERAGKVKFNWGYNPLNYNCVEGSYSSDPMDPLARIVEYKNLIKAYSENANHTRVIMDVVYNHVSSASSSCFTKVMPKYYFRYTPDWSYHDGSGCSNEVKSDAPMMRKYIVDSLVWWAKEYKIKGFRFDLMGLIDTWTLRQAKETLYAYDPDIVLYGEGWTSGGYHGKYEMNGDNLVNGGAETKLVYSQLYHSQQSPGQVGGFNDGSRDALRGSNDDGYAGFPYPQWGFISQDYQHVGSKSDEVVAMMKGANNRAPGVNPCQTINYVSCHDNYTLWDQLRFTLASSYDDTTREPSGAPSVADTVNASIASHAAVMMSNGVAFMQGGEELYRTKSYSYDLTDLAKLMQGGADAVVRPFPTYDHYSSDPNVIQATADVKMYGDIITHNSYKSPDYVNSFKWDRKIEVDGVSTYDYNETWKKMVHARENITFVDYSTMYEQHDTSNYNSWGNGSGCTVIAAWTRISATQGYGMFFAGKGGGSFDWGGISVDDIVFQTGTNITRSGDTVTLGSYSFICYRLNG